MPELNKQASVTSAAPNGSAAPSRSALINGELRALLCQERLYNSEKIAPIFYFDVLGLI